MAVMTGIISTVGIGGTGHLFQWQMDPNDISNHGEITFFVYENPPNAHEFYTHTFIVLKDGSYQSVMMNNNGFPAFAKKGIPEMILETASNIFKKDIKSSSTKMLPGNFMTRASQKAWDRLVLTNPRATKLSDHYLLKA